MTSLSTATLRLFVSSSRGSDDATGLDIDRPLRTIKAAMAKIEPGRTDPVEVLLCRGDTFSEPVGEVRCGHFSLGTYGGDWIMRLARKNAVVTPPAGETCLYRSGAGGTPPLVSIVIGEDVELRAPDRSSLGWADESCGIHWTGGGTLVFGGTISGFCSGIVMNAMGQPAAFIDKGGRVYGCFRVGNHSNGVLIEGGVKTIVFDGTRLTRNGWHPELKPRDDRSHNVYIQSDCGPALFLEVESDDASAHAIMARGGAVLVRCRTPSGGVREGSPAGVIVGGGDTAAERPVVGLAYECDFGQGRGIHGPDDHGRGITFKNCASPSVVFSHFQSPARRTATIDSAAVRIEQGGRGDGAGVDGLAVIGNTFRNWKGPHLEEQIQAAPARAWAAVLAMGNLVVGGPNEAGRRPLTSGWGGVDGLVPGGDAVERWAE